jgi:hypothetical protein
MVVLASAGRADAESARVDLKADIQIALDRSVNQMVRSETTPLVESAVREAAAARWIVFRKCDLRGDRGFHPEG